MCAPVLGAVAPAFAGLSGLGQTLMIASLGLSVAQGVMGYQAQKAQFKAQSQQIAATEAAAAQSMHSDLAMLTLRQRQEAQSAEKKVFENRKQALAAKGQALASSGSVQGLSVSQLLNDFTAQEAQFADSVAHNKELRLEQLGAERKRVHARAVSRVAGLAPAVGPSLGNTALGIAGSTLGTASTFLGNPNFRRGI